MILGYKNVPKTIQTIQYYIFNLQHHFLIKKNKLKNTMLIIKNHFSHQFKVLTAISGVDYPKDSNRFNIVYELLCIKYNSRLRVKVLADEIVPVDSVEKIFSGANWFECEIWDMFGIFFSNKSKITRLLTDYGFQGFPLRKDFPLSGFAESRFSHVKNRIVYENVELSQEYRIFDFFSPWGGFKLNI